MFTTADTEGYRELLEGVKMRTLVHGDRTLLAEFKLDKGASIPTHRHPYEQTGYLVAGSLRFVVEGTTTVARPGDSWNLAEDVEHSADVLEDSVVVEVFSPVREDYLP